MAEPVFLRRAAPLSLSEIAALVGGRLQPDSMGDRTVDNVAPLDEAGPSDLTFLENPKYLAQLAGSEAGCCLLSEKHAASAPPSMAALICAQPYRAYAVVAAKLFPQSARPGSSFEQEGVSPAAHVHPTAELENGVQVDPGAVVGPRAQIGSGASIGANAVIGPDVCIGRNCSIGSGAHIRFALIGDRVIVHPGVCIGQDGFGFAMGPGGHLKVPQLGRVIIQNDVEIGANTAIDRGTNRDTVIGEGTKIDNFVQIGHNVVIGRHCIIVAHVAIAGSSVLEDFVAVGGQVGVAGHIRIGQGAQIAAQSGLVNDIPAGQRWGGSPARPARQWAREISTLEKLARKDNQGS
jgi:UDP-3-O-[3-hydroxymyristoyl] glucosamine N-acyltransferase